MFIPISGILCTYFPMNSPERGISLRWVKITTQIVSISLKWMDIAGITTITALIFRWGGSQGPPDSHRLLGACLMHASP
ncbi:hypothetical protein ABEO75_06165, partial [Paenibacillus macerans]|uniref:hypothetical protein n=1 Tax=Paenibacillus macerans TaxID=44252 RepID=UPI003D268FAB